MSPQASTTTEKKTRTRSPSVRITEGTRSKLDRLAEITARKVAESGGIRLHPSHSQLVEAMVDSALDSDNGSA